MGELTVENLTKNYGDLLALDNVSLRVGTGEVFVLLGPNGAGKTTLLKIVVGILKPTRGTVRLDMYDVVKNPEDAKRIIGYLPENPSLYTGLTVTEFLQFVGKIRNVPDQPLEVKIREALRTFEIDEKKDALVGSLSKGTKQKVALIASSLHDHHFLVLDEPLSGLDPKTQRFVNQWIAGMGQKGVTVLLSTHNLDIAQQYASRMAIIDKGRIVAVGEMEELRKIAKTDSEARLDDVFLKLTEETS